jgi:hypothetical protein
MALNFFKLNSKLDLFVIFIIFIKFVFVISAVGHFLLSHSHNMGLQKTIDPQFVYWKERTEFIFIVSMAVLLLYYFRPGKEHTINKETSFLFYLFGWVLLLTSKWNLFFEESKLYKVFANALQ